MRKEKEWFDVLKIGLKVIRRKENWNFERKSQTLNEKWHDERKCLNFLSWILVHTKSQLSFGWGLNNWSHLKRDTKICEKALWTWCKNWKGSLGD